MDTAEKIYKQVKGLPDPCQREVLDFVEYLSLKLRREDLQWQRLSLQGALRGLEGEEWPNYETKDIQEMWS
jgi:hypothetical protein